MLRAQQESPRAVAKRKDTTEKARVNIFSRYGWSLVHCIGPPHVVMVAVFVDSLQYYTCSVMAPIVCACTTNVSSCVARSEASEAVISSS